MVYLAGRRVSVRAVIPNGVRPKAMAKKPNINRFV